MFSEKSPALLALEDGSLFWGNAIGAPGSVVGEVVFNTALTGYQEILTDPSYTDQLVTLTYPHIGNVGTNEEDIESNSVAAKALIIRDESPIASSWRSNMSLGDYLKANNTAGIAGIDTRRLTRVLREKGSLNGCLMSGEGIDSNEAIKMAKAYPGLQGKDLASQVTTDKSYVWSRSVWDLEKGYPQGEHKKLKVVAYDFGVKFNILRLLVDRGCEVTVVPATTPAKEVIKQNPDGVFLSNGPGDPAPCDYAITAVQEILKKKIPVFGICLGHQILALASGAKTEKMKFGHHGANHPVQDLEDGRVLITSQNHGFAVNEKSLPNTVRASHRSLFDGSLQGIQRTDVPAFSFQGHPEASPGPHDVQYLFDQFIRMMEESKR
ncbi:MAG: glutamine-hydrolyzing carbamoyl-phosphate synthase small subunit [Gammaproteobacteria bacterium]|nr:glutamine-hydrolyzing carbamoyl-phosphate synthase small subunit [Gammaproteobacteria bacterium]